MATSSSAIARMHLHESLMASMMARSTPRVLFHSSHVRRGITVLEILAGLNAVALFITLFALHTRFVRGDGCGCLLEQARLGEGGDGPVLEMGFERVAFRFSRERGLLLLSDGMLRRLNVSVERVEVGGSEKCLGDVVSRGVLKYVIGYETVAVNAFARMRGRWGWRDGYVMSVETRRVLNLMHAEPGLGGGGLRRFCLRVMWKLGAVMTAAFIMCTTGALVAFTLREVQVRMIKLTMDLQVIMRSQMGYGRVIVRYAMDALVFIPIVAGMLFFLFEFFDDQTLAFVVLVLTWLCEFAASGSTRHWISRYYLPKLFFCYFGAFHVYFFSFPLGFSWLALATSIVFMVHAALTVWNHCELPLLRHERFS